MTKKCVRASHSTEILHLLVEFVEVASLTGQCIARSRRGSLTDIVHTIVQFAQFSALVRQSRTGAGWGSFADIAKFVHQFVASTACTLDRERIFIRLFIASIYPASVSEKGYRFL